MKPSAEKLEDSDLTYEKFRSLIVRKIDDIKSRKDLPTSISFFKEGVEFLYAEFDEGKFRSGYNAATAQAVSAETLSLTLGMRNLGLDSLDKLATRNHC